MRKNLDIRVEVLKADLFLKDVAEKMNVNAFQFYRDLRSREFTPKEKDRVYEAIELMGVSKNEYAKLD